MSPHADKHRRRVGVPGAIGNGRSMAASGHGTRLVMDPELVEGQKHALMCVRCRAALAPVDLRMLLRRA